MAGVAILIPVLRRPHRVAPLVENIEATTPEPHAVVFIADEDDVEEHEALHAVGARWTAVSAPPPNYPAKMNFGYRCTDEPFVFLAADDVVFHDGWLTAALAQMGDNIAVVGTNDGGVNPSVRRGRHAVHMLVRRAYVDTVGATFNNQPGVLVHEGYHHAYVDNELVHAARQRGAYAHAHDSLVEHLHPYGGKADTDEVYRIGQADIATDEKLWNRRTRLMANLQSWT